MSICLLVPVDCFKALPVFTERINCRHTPQMVWSPVTALHISLLYWMWLTPPDIYIFLQPCILVANKRREKRGERGGKKARQAARQVIVWNTEEGCVELWLGTPSRSIFPCLKPQCLGNGRTAGAFRGYGAGDEGSRSGEAKLRGDFPSRGLFILGEEEVSALPLLLEPGGKQANCSPQKQGTGIKLDLTWYRVLSALLPFCSFYLSLHTWNVNFIFWSFYISTLFFKYPSIHRSLWSIHTCILETKNTSATGIQHKKDILSPPKSIAAQRPLILLRSL